MKNLFSEHPNSVGQSYSEHFLFALTIAGTCLVITIVATIHSVLPFIFKNTGSTLLQQLNRKIEARDSNSAKQ